MAGAKLAPGTGAKLARFVAIYLAIELVPFLAIHSVYHKSIASLVFAYFVFGVPALVMVPIYGLWQLDAHGASPRLLGWGWFWVMQFMTSPIILGMAIGGVTIHVVARDEAIWGFIVWQMVMAPIAFFTGYLRVLTIKSAEQEVG